ncbi:hypothetical protein [Epilithonimonas sp.]|uniref:hypothetical protein n=1 Tax=Epilithonimonas sp. TaxID=2894511 RepID=UPI00289ACAE4|nr:hypothetical protein [Epilithonimonas sp.]
MKKKLLLFNFVYGLCFSQVAIGKTELESASSSMEFGSEKRGLVLPWVTSENAVSGVVNGTLVFDVNDKKVKAYVNNAWKDLSVNTNGIADTTLQDGLVEETGAKVSFGPVTSTPGILVLEDTNRAMILPKVANPHLNIVSPTPGMIVYDTTKKMLAVFNGAVWTFWKGS